MSGFARQALFSFIRAGSGRFTRNARFIGGMLAINCFAGYQAFIRHSIHCEELEKNKTSISSSNVSGNSPPIATFFTSEEVRKRVMDSIVLIYSERTQKPIAAGIVIDEDGSFMTISNIFDLESKHPSHQFYAKSIREDYEDIEFTFSIDYSLHQDNISFCSIKRHTQSQHLPFKKSEFPLESAIPSIGTRVYVVGKSNADFKVIEEGILNENKLSSEQAFDFSAQSFLMMANIGNKYTSMYGGPILDETGRVLAMNYPIPNSFIKSHVIGVPCYFLTGIIKQYLEKKEVRRPYVGLSVKWTQDVENGGAFILKVNSESPGAKANLKLGEIITEVNSIKIRDGKDLARVIGYSIGEVFKLKVFRNGKSRIVELKTE